MAWGVARFDQRKAEPIRRAIIIPARRPQAVNAEMPGVPAWRWKRQPKGAGPVLLDGRPAVVINLAECVAERDEVDCGLVGLAKHVVGDGDSQRGYARGKPIPASVGPRSSSGGRDPGMMPAQESHGIAAAISMMARVEAERDTFGVSLLEEGFDLILVFHVRFRMGWYTGCNPSRSLARSAIGAWLRSAASRGRRRVETVWSADR